MHSPLSGVFSSLAFVLCFADDVMSEVHLLYRHSTAASVLTLSQEPGRRLPVTGAHLVTGAWQAAPSHWGSPRHRSLAGCSQSLGLTLSQEPSRLLPVTGAHLVTGAWQAAPSHCGSPCHRSLAGCSQSLWITLSQELGRLLLVTGARGTPDAS